MRVVVVGLGNSIMTDDSVGLRVALRVRELLDAAELPDGVSIEVKLNECGGMSLLDDLEGADAAVLVDCVVDGSRRAGEIIVATDLVCPNENALFAALCDRGLLLSNRMLGTHGQDLGTVLRFAAGRGIVLPRRIGFVGVVGHDVDRFGESCNAEVERVVPEAAAEVMASVFSLHPRPVC